MGKPDKWTRAEVDALMAAMDLKADDRVYRVGDWQIRHRPLTIDRVELVLAERGGKLYRQIRTSHGWLAIVDQVSGTIDQD